MLAETIREWEEHNVKRGREEGREENRRLLCHMAALRFGDATADAIRPLLNSIRDGAQITAVGRLIIDSKTAEELSPALVASPSRTTSASNSGFHRGCRTEWSSCC